MTRAGEARGTTALVRHLATDPAFEGIGYALAARLAEAFGDDLPRRLAAGDPAPFEPIVGARAATTLVAAWREDQARNDIVVWLDENGLDPRLAGRIVRLWGAEGARRIREHPYALMALADWPAVDAVARRLGVAARDPARLVAAVEAVLYARLQRQHTWTPRPELVAGVRRLLGGSVEGAEEALRLAAHHGAAMPLADGWQPAGAAMMERFVAGRIREMLDGPGMGDLIAREVDDAELDGWLTGARAAIGVDLNDEQRAAVRLAVQGRFGLVLGGAGVGKTTVLRAVCAASEAFGRVVHLMALAGRAAVRMREATGRPSSTIAAFLKSCEAGQVPLGPESLVVIDESSMLDLPTLYRILRHLPDGCRVLLVGDEAQLGPIGFGLTLHAFADVDLIPKVRLTRIYRQAAATGIPAVAAAIRTGSLPHLPAGFGRGDGVVLVPTRGAPTAADVVEVVASLGGFRDDLRILSPVKGGDIGTLALNGRFHGIMAPGRPRLSGHAFALGEPVVFGKNDYRRDLRNGSLGTVVDVAGDVLTVEFDGVRHGFSGPALHDLALAYAVTVHKAQGSQFRTVVVPVVPTRLLDRALIYTAVTRASRQVALVGDRDVLAAAVAATSAAAQRLTGLTGGGFLQGPDVRR
ncbi:AAA family ATPase [Microvirga sp. BT689]|uniref:AAA family ATPase n=1 Tax=Microvirga arvi TaxID=2778731 RepID=UPI00194E68EF|nr:AAA family ATPase [Microvirga arvi]MBM6581667.1 AAA family ATPase [Microvirga arvi]